MSQLSPWQHYQKDLSREGFCHDPAQEIAVKALQRVYEDLTTAEVPLSIVDKLLIASGV
ncbi:MAG: cell division protein ZapE, partial [Shewanella sp.]